MFKKRISLFKRRLTTVGEAEPLNKLSLAVIILLDIFILSIIFAGLKDHTDQLTSHSEYMPYEARQVFIEQTWSPATRMTKLQEFVLTDRKQAAQGSRHRNRCAAFNAVANRSVNRSLFVPFVKGLEQGDAMCRQVLLGLIPKVNDTGSHDELTKLLGSHDEELRKTVKEILTHIGGPSALTALTKQVRRHDFGGRLDAMDVMVQKARHRAIPLIIAIIESGIPWEGSCPRLDMKWATSRGISSRRSLRVGRRTRITPSRK